MNDLVYVAIALLEVVVLWELTARLSEPPMVPLAPAELAVRLGLPPPAAVVPRLAAIAGPVLPPPPADRLAGARPVDLFAVRVRPGQFVVVFVRELELPGELARLIQLDQVLGEVGGWRASGRN